MANCPTCGEEIEEPFDSCWKCAKAVLAEPSSPENCPRCRGARVAAGRIIEHDDDGISYFRPDEIRLLARTFAPGVKLSQHSFACLDCGLVWTDAPPTQLKAFVEKHCRAG